ncbi:TetR/AcrR family transcriptional regulator [Streptomyces sp. M19]
MGHREDLLEGAKRCLLEKGWVGTTARDIVSASGANLASIGYHYGSKDALLAEAFFTLTEEWGDTVERRLEEGAAGRRPDAPYDGDAGRGDRQLRRAPAVLARPVGGARADGAPPDAAAEDLRRAAPGPGGILAMFEGVDDCAFDTFDPETVRTAGAFYHSLFIGLWIQWLIDPENAPTGRDLAEGCGG